MFYALRESYEKELVHLHRFISPGMVVIDGGANCGIYTVLAARLVGPSGLVLSFEPASEAFSVLERNVCLNGLRNVQAYQTALSDREEETELYHHEPGSNSFSLGSSGTMGVRSERVSTRTLGNVLREESIDRVGFIKLDVEGAEELALRGAEGVITYCHPTIIFEMNASAAKRLRLSPSGSWGLLEGWGYKFFFLNEFGHLCRMREPPPSIYPANIVAVHSDGLK